MANYNYSTSVTVAAETDLSTATYDWALGLITDEEYYCLLTGTNPSAFQVILGNEAGAYHNELWRDSLHLEEAILAL